MPVHSRSANICKASAFHAWNPGRGRGMQAQLLRPGSLICQKETITQDLQAVLGEEPPWVRDSESGRQAARAPWGSPGPSEGTPQIRRPPRTGTAEQRTRDVGKPCGEALAVPGPRASATRDTAAPTACLPQGPCPPRVPGLQSSLSPAARGSPLDSQPHGHLPPQTGLRSRSGKETGRPRVPLSLEVSTARRSSAGQILLLVLGPVA